MVTTWEAPAREARKAAPAAPIAAQEPHGWRAYALGLEKAIGKVIGVERHAASLRFAEAERRIAELEARLAEMDGGSR